MNLTNYTQTSIAKAFAAVHAEAEQRGVRVLESEIIGLAPAAALACVDPRALRLTRFREQQVLETRMRDEPAVDSAVRFPRM